MSQVESCVFLRDLSWGVVHQSVTGPRWQGSLQVISYGKDPGPDERLAPASPKKAGEPTTRTNPPKGNIKKVPQNTGKSKISMPASPKAQPAAPKGQATAPKARPAGIPVPPDTGFTGSVVWSWESPVAGLTCLTKATTKEGRFLLLAGGMDGELRVYEEGTNSGRVIESGDYRPVLTTDFSSVSNSLLSAGWDMRIKRYKLREDGTFHLEEGIMGHYKNIQSVKWKKEGNIFSSASRDGTLKIWDIRESSGLKPTLTISGPYPFYSVDFHPHKNDLLAAGNEEGLVGYDLRHTESPIIDDNWGGAVKALSFCSEGAPLLAVGSDTGETAALDFVDPHPKKIFSCQQQDFVRAVSWANENTYLCGGGWGRTKQNLQDNLFLCKIK